MKIVEAPSVYLIGKQIVDEEQLGQFLDANDIKGWATDADGGQKLVEVAGRVCYMSFSNPRPGGNKAYIEHILEVGHGSVAEHCVFTLLIEGVSRSLTHELVRHRHFSPSQLSQRYCDRVAFVKPPGIGGIASEAIWERSLREAVDSYELLLVELDRDFAHIEDKTLRRKRVREAARAVLPNCTETKIVLTGNARTWRNFLELRGSIHADQEIQVLASRVFDLLREAAPNIFGDYKVTMSGLETEYRKV
ncbi:THY1 Predicted alternative thymidylate synthase [uncultured Caudovirales phage]|uniref:THY1 Predicted alternative thymidylate synthase n=1 Tax=uncultured Caudovirales phage TaxID=2100421 RepID=A0A6J7XL39_9CAUD|nr:THY1 Predicted alternative thymidylate synthase [uncultured Caudovirales phage]